MQIAADDNDHARQSLSRIVQQYPRTDAAAATTVALASIADSQRQKMIAEIDRLRNDSAGQQKQIAALTQRVDELAARPLPPAGDCAGGADEASSKENRDKAAHIAAPPALTPM